MQVSFGLIPFSVRRPSPTSAEQQKPRKKVETSAGSPDNKSTSKFHEALINPRFRCISKRMKSSPLTANPRKSTWVFRVKNRFYRNFVRRCPISNIHNVRENRTFSFFTRGTTEQNRLRNDYAEENSLLEQEGNTQRR